MLMRLPENSRGQAMGWVVGQVTYRSTSRMRLVSLFTTWISSSVCAKFTRPFLSTWNWGETARSAMKERCLFPGHLLSMPRGKLMWQETLKPGMGLVWTPLIHPSLGCIRHLQSYGLYRQGTLKGHLPSTMWKVTYPLKQPQR